MLINRIKCKLLTQFNIEKFVFIEDLSDLKLLINPVHLLINFVIFGMKLKWKI